MAQTFPLGVTNRNEKPLCGCTTCKSLFIYLFILFIYFTIVFAFPSLFLLSVGGLESTQRNKQKFFNLEKMTIFQMRGVRVVSQFLENFFFTLKLSKFGVILHCFHYVKTSCIWRSCNMSKLSLSQKLYFLLLVVAFSF